MTGRELGTPQHGESGKPQDLLAQCSEGLGKSVGHCGCQARVLAVSFAQTVCSRPSLTRSFPLLRPHPTHRLLRKVSRSNQSLMPAPTSFSSIMFRFGLPLSKHFYPKRPCWLVSVGVIHQEVKPQETLPERFGTIAPVCSPV